MKVAVITHDFSGFSGSEIVALEVANYFGSRGDQVTVRAERHSEALKPHLKGDIEIASSRIDITDFDLVWSQHGHFCLNTRDLSALKNWKGHFVSVHLSGSTPAETYHHPFASRYAATRVFNSSEAIRLLEGDQPGPDVLNMRNAAPIEFHNAPNSHEVSLKHLLVVSNHLPSEVQLAMKLAEQSGIKVTHLGNSGTYRLITPKDILGADAVVSIGKTVQYALCSAKPAYCYDHFGGPGWLSSENFEVAENRNFSGRCNQAQKTPQEIYDELINGYEEATSFAVSNWKRHSDRYNLNCFMDDLCGGLKGNLFSRHGCAEEVEAMRGALLHFNWIWEDVFAKDRIAESRLAIEALEARLLEVPILQTRVRELERLLTQTLEKPGKAVRESLKFRITKSASNVVRPLSESLASKLMKSAQKRDPRRHLLSDHDE